MIGLPNPWMILGALAVCAGAYFYGHHAGWADRDQDVQAEVAKANEKARETEAKLRDDLTTTDAKLKEANNVVAQKESALDRAIRAGRVRLPTPSCVQTAASAAPASGDRNEARGQPDRPADAPSDAERETLRLIAQLAAEGDRAINQLNACIDAYNQVMGAINGKR